LPEIQIAIPNQRHLPFETFVVESSTVFGNVNDLEVPAMPDMRVAFIHATTRTLRESQLPKVIDLLALAELFPDESDIDHCVSEIRSAFGGLANVLDIVAAGGPNPDLRSSATETPTSIDLLIKELADTLERLPVSMLERHVQFGNSAPTVLELIIGTVAQVSVMLGEATGIGEHLRSADPEANASFRLGSVN